MIHPTSQDEARYDGPLPWQQPPRSDAQLQRVIMGFIRESGGRIAQQRRMVSAAQAPVHGSLQRAVRAMADYHAMARSLKRNTPSS